MNQKRIEWDFKYHAPDAGKQVVHKHINEIFLGMVSGLNELLPDCREKSIVITRLEEARMWANAAVARNPRPEDSV